MSDQSGRLLDKQWVRRGFERNAARYEEASFLAREVATRMGERLDLLRAAPAMVLDLGSGTGLDARMLRNRYPHCTAVEIDLAPAMLAQAHARDPSWWRSLRRWKRDRPARVCGDSECLPFRAGTFGMVWANLTLHWTHLPATLSEVRRVLRPGGVFMFSTLGPDTLKELRASYAHADALGHVNRFVDMHDVGDLLLHARFADPVMDMEYLTLTYERIDDLLRDLRTAGGHNANLDRPAGLSGRHGFTRMRTAYEALRRDGRLPATFEIVYGQAWRPETERRTASGEQVVAFRPRTGASR